MTDIAALQLESRFSMPPNSLGYCGKDSAPEKFTQCIIHGNCKGVKQEVSKFIVLYPYLKTLAEIFHLPVFSYQVIEAYWIGNTYLHKAKNEHYDLTLKNFSQQGVPDWLIEELRQKRPKRYIPTHLFQVLHVGVGRASGAVPFNLESINNCMIRWGTVEDISREDAAVNLNSLQKKKTSYTLHQAKQTVLLKKEMFPGIGVGCVVAVHWNMIVKILTSQEQKSIEFWTNEVINSL